MPNLGILLAEKGLLPDALIRYGIRQRLRRKLRQLEAQPRSPADWIEHLAQLPLAQDTAAANEQHYEVPTAYFLKALGPHLKYSSAYWDEQCDSLASAEEAMLTLTCERAELRDGQDILELGCGWGSLSLFMAARYPNAKITTVSNSQTQRQHIEAQARDRGLHNLEVITCDINHFQPNRSFDRLVSVEMFEHVRNHRQLFTQIATWLKPDAKVFIHIFAHHTHTFLYEAEHPDDWMARYFFTGGIMPAADLLPLASADAFHEDTRWEVNGCHYQKTLDAWLALHDAKRETVLETLRPCYGAETDRWFHRWRLFYLACSELFGYNQGVEWKVMHYRFTLKPRA
jgi:cyclopropane-fatty-acyl-phospholipid synthase